MNDQSTSRRANAQESNSKDKENDFFAARLMEYLAVAAFALDCRGRVLIWNKACERLTGISANEVVGTKEHWKALYDTERPCLADLVVENRPKDAETLYAAWTNTEVNPSGLSAENWCVMPRLGKRLYLAFDAGPIYDDKGQLVAVVETLRDLTSHKEMETELEELAGRDALTSIANRRTFDNKLAEEWRRAGRHGAPLSLLMIDVDLFKQYNDGYGHQAGDECLKRVALSIQQEVARAEDLAARIGGEEFAVVLPHTPLEGAMTVAERIRRAVEGARLPHGISRVSDHVTVSMGVVSSCADIPLADFVARADQALYRAKKNGRNRVEPYVSPVDLIEIDRKSA